MPAFLFKILTILKTDKRIIINSSYTEQYFPILVSGNKIPAAYFIYGLPFICRSVFDFFVLVRF
jgi:hypothetical protein